MIEKTDIYNYGDIGKVINFFQEIAKIPRNSGKEQGMVNYLKNFANTRNGLEFYSDEFNNVIIKKRATNGNNNYLAFQSHTDMVCEKINSSTHDFDKDPIDLIIEDDYIKSNGTNIGADNGIGVAYMLAILDSDNIEHPNLEMIFTSEEETTMNGAKNIDLSKINSNRIISFDAFSDKTINCGCASNYARTIRIDKKRALITKLENMTSYKIRLNGFERWTFWKRYCRKSWQSNCRVR